MLKPLAGTIIIAPDQAPTETAGGIFLPEAARPTPTTGTVRAVGPGRRARNGRRLPHGIAPGDRVAYTAKAGIAFWDHHRGEDVLVAPASTVLAVIG